MHRGLLIVFEGPDFCGKSTQAELLSQYFISMDVDFRSFYEPGCTVMGDAIRPILLDKDIERNYETEALLFAACSSELNGQIRSIRERGTHIILDRYHPSFYAYQHEANGLDWQWLHGILATAQQEIPSITFYLMPSFHTLCERKNVAARTTPLDQIESRPDSYHLAVYSGYEEYIKTDPTAYVIRGEDMVASIHEKIINAFNAIPYTGDRS